MIIYQQQVPGRALDCHLLDPIWVSACSPGHRPLSTSTRGVYQVSEAPGGSTRFRGGDAEAGEAGKWIQPGHLSTLLAPGWPPE